MFPSQNNEEKKLDWMYKGPSSMVDREEYLLGRSVDKTLEELNAEEKQKHQGLPVQPKNRVEHECIPPSIRDFNKIVQSEQVDISAKMQEDPLVAIKKREEESRRQFLQNPVQIKKLQKALKAQAKQKKKKSKKSKESDSDLDIKIPEKLKLLKNNLLNDSIKNKKLSKKERDLDTILIHKFNALKDQLSDKDMKDILDGKTSSSENEQSESDEDSDASTKQLNKRKYENTHRQKTKNFDENKRGKMYDYQNKYETNKKSESDSYRKTNISNRDRNPKYDINKYNKNSNNSKYESSDTDSDSNKNRRNYGLVRSDGSRIPLNKSSSERKSYQSKQLPIVEQPKPVQDKYKVKKLSEDEKERLRKEMMQNAAKRDKERAHNLKKFRENEERESKQQKEFDPNFVHKELRKSAINSSVESRIKSNVNKIQRSSGDMNVHFSRR